MLSEIPSEHRLLLFWEIDFSKFLVVGVDTRSALTFGFLAIYTAGMVSMPLQHWGRSFF